MMKILKKLLKTFKRVPEKAPEKAPEKPSLAGAHHLFHKLAEDAENAVFYITQIEDFRASTELKSYCTKAHFGLSSARDELKISLDNHMNELFRKAYDKRKSDRT